MIPLLVLNSSTPEAEIKRPPPTQIVRECPPRFTQRANDSLSEEEKYILKLLACLFVLLILPALMAILFIILNPEAFMNDVTPTNDFSTWQRGQRP